MAGDAPFPVRYLDHALLGITAAEAKDLTRQLAQLKLWNASERTSRQCTCRCRRLRRAPYSSLEFFTPDGDFAAIGGRLA